MSTPEERFAAFDWEKDQEWKDYISRIDIPAGKDNTVVVDKLKRKWFKKNKDAELELNSGPSSSGSSSNTTNGGPSASTTTKPETPPQAAPAKAEPTTLREFFLRQETIHLLLSVWLIYNVIMYFVAPFIGGGNESYHRACNAAFIKFVSKFLHKHPFSFSGITSTCKGLWNKDYHAAMAAQKVVNSSDLHGAFIYFLFNSTPPIPFTLFPIFLSSLYSVCSWQSTLLKLVSPSLAGMLDPVLQKFIQHGKPNQETGITNILYWNAWLSFGIAAALFVQLLTPNRSLLLFIVYIQFLLIRHTAPDARHQRIVTGEIKARTDGLFHHERCPGFVTMGYDKVLGLLATLTKRTGGP